MGFFLEYDAKNNVLRGYLEGRVTDETFRDAYTTAAKYVAQVPCRGIWDLSGVMSFEVSSDEIRKLAAGPPIVPRGYGRVVVAPQNYLFGMMRMFQMLGEETRPDLHVVRTMDEAYRLLRVESPEFRPVS